MLQSVTESHVILGTNFTLIRFIYFKPVQNKSNNDCNNP
jgi:hypothetical protein